MDLPQIILYMVSFVRPAILVVLLFTSIWCYAQKFSVSFTPETGVKSFSGNIFLYLSKDIKDPKDQDVGTSFFPCFRIKVLNIKPGQAVVFNDAAVSFPVSLSEIERGDYYVQAVWDRNLGGRPINNSPGNIYNTSEQVKLTRDQGRLFEIRCNKVIAEDAFRETAFVKELKVPSRLLSSFFHKAVDISAAVLLPKEYDQQPNRHFPVLYWVSGYGGDYHRFSGSLSAGEPLDTTPVIRVFLDGNCPLGHSVYTNSDNNGPWGDALTQELIPEVEKRYRCNKVRLLHGHSSGGWTVLSLQIHYPRVFTACWSSSPDPVDFRNFQKIDLYNDRSMFYSKDSILRMTATVAGRIPWATMKQAYQMEYVISRGEQMRSFDAVFSQKSEDGTPRTLCNYQTGAIDPETVEHWKKYDLSLFLRTNWDKIKGDLQGKIRVSVGDQDNFLLNYAVHMLDEEMQKLKAGFVFNYYPGDHFTVGSTAYKMDGYYFLEKKCHDFLNSSQGAGQ